MGRIIPYIMEKIKKFETTSQGILSYGRLPMINGEITSYFFGLYTLFLWGYKHL